MRRMLFIATGVLLVMLLAMLYLSTMAVADGGVHESYRFTVDSDVCASCHRVHTGQSEQLLAGGSGSQESFCYTCHGNTQTGAYTDVQWGTFDTTGPTNWQQEFTGSVDNEGLRGGGFVKAFMDTDAGTAAASPASLDVTSTHYVGGGSTTGTAWGGIDVASAQGNNAGNTITGMRCANCHNPHGNGNYRILRGNPSGMVDVAAAPSPDAAVNLGDEYLWGTTEVGTGIVIDTASGLATDGVYDSDYASAAFDAASDAWTFTDLDAPPSWLATAYRVEVRFYVTGHTDDIFKLQVSDDNGTTWYDAATFPTDTVPTTVSAESYDVLTIDTGNPAYDNNAELGLAQIRFIVTSIEPSASPVADDFTIYIDGARLSYKKYTVTYATDGTESRYFRDTSYAPTNLGSWCAQCHRVYLADEGVDPGSTLQTNTDIFKYRHATKGTNLSADGECLACHVAHGSSAVMTDATGSAFPWPDGTTPGGSDQDSRLLHADQRGICWRCHDITAD